LCQQKEIKTFIYKQPKNKKMATTEKQPIKASEILAMLAEGKSREEIRTHFNMKKIEFARFMKHPALKGKKTKTGKKNDPFILVDDVTPTTTPTASEAVETAPQSEPQADAPEAKEDQETY
jgi:hypothetical protein